ncbi:P-loop containing nucleoside triphosphate hydrolase protein [Annulohypoxylon moriforme]|nr:P-loop containing nucleoside triphosphate hydrolase protein [Annulohypoxylon moriforme]
MAPSLKPNVDRDEDDSQSCSSGDSSSYSSSISSSPSTCANTCPTHAPKPSDLLPPDTKPRLFEDENKSDETRNTHSDSIQSTDSIIGDATEKMECCPIHPRFRHRSRSVLGDPRSSYFHGPTTMIDDINDLKSFYQAWEKKHAVPDTAKGREDELGSFPADDAFVFPFFHLDSSDFWFHEYPYRFPFFHLNDPVFCASQRQIIFPFSHLHPWYFGCRTKCKSDILSPLDKLLRMVGLEEIKKEFLSVRDRVKAAKPLKDMPSFRSLNLDLIITGNAGTGKSTIAKLYKEYLEFLGIPESELTLGPPVGGFPGSRATMRSRRWSFFSDLDFIDNPEWGPGYGDGLGPGYGRLRAPGPGRRTGLEDTVFILDVNKDNLKDVFNKPKMYGHISRRLDLKDYTEDELLRILVGILRDYSLKVKGGFGAPFLRMFVRKIEYGRGQKKYKNVHTLQDEVKKVLNRRAERLEKATEGGTNMIVHIRDRTYRLTESDFFGFPPTDVYKESEAWKKLEKMAGMEKIKDAVKGLVSRRNINYSRERVGEEALKTAHNYVFLGPPGTGKTTVASLFGQVIAELGFIDSSTVVMKKPSDFLGQYVGHSEDKTRQILKETEGKTLIIDEAHMLYHASEYGTDKSDIFRKGIVDTIVANVDNEPGNNRCIILAGYPDRMKEFYRNTNPGFQRRFPLEDAFVFENYDTKTLGEILDIMLAQDGLSVTEEAKSVATEILERQRELPNFGNGGAVRNMISRALATYNKRISSIARELEDREDEQNKIILEPHDFDPEYDRGSRSERDYRSLFKDLVGFEDIISVFEGYQTMTVNMLQYGLDPREEVPFSFIFKGPPGTGKTTTARALGQIYYSMGFLSTTEVVDCSVTDLIGTHVGQTGPKVQNLLEKALGKVLFVDEAYRIAQTDHKGGSSNQYAREAVGELVDCMTKERFARKLVIVLAGYGGDMDKFVDTNEGLRGRFTEMVFPNMRSEDCLLLLQKKLSNKKIRISSSMELGMRDRVINLFGSLSRTKAWANARDVETISKSIVRRVFMKKMPAGEHVGLPLEEVAVVLRQLLRERGG